MGASIGLSSNPASIMQAVKRGLHLVVMGYALNIMRGVLPQLFLFLFWDEGGGDEFLEDLLGSLLEPDSLHTSGIAIVFLAWLRPFPQYFLIMSAMVILIASQWLWGFDTGNIFVNGLLNIAFDDDEMDYNSAMPIFPWLAYSIIGMGFGKKVAYITSTRAFHNICAKYGTLMVLVGVVVRLCNPGFLSHDEDFRSGAVGVIWISGLILWWLWFLDHFNSIVLPKLLYQRLVVWSKNVTFIFCVHSWLMICWSPLVFPLSFLQNQGPMGIVIITVITLSLTDYITTKAVNWRNLQATKKIS
jgi:hypothetical protein